MTYFAEQNDQTVRQMVCILCGCQWWVDAAQATERPGCPECVGCADPNHWSGTFPTCHVDSMCSTYAGDNTAFAYAIEALERANQVPVWHPWDGMTNLPRWNQTHLAALVKAEHTTQRAIGSKVRDWACYVTQSSDYDHLSPTTISRAFLQQFCGDQLTTPEECFLACMAWGNMNRRHGRMAWARKEHWLGVLTDLRAGKLTRTQAYAEFAKLRSDGKLKGVGPAYFTKLIYFLHPAHNGYIMDQWTAKSMQLLTSSETPILSRQGYVTDANDGAVYECFCRAIYDLAAHLRVTGAKAEECIFSVGGRRPGEWRAHVKKHWRSA